MKMQQLGLFTSSLLLTACAIGPDYDRPKLSIPEKFQMAEVAQEAESFANLPRWELVKDEELQRLIRDRRGDCENLCSGRREGRDHRSAEG